MTHTRVMQDISTCLPPRGSKKSPVDPWHCSQLQLLLTGGTGPIARAMASGFTPCADEVCDDVYPCQHARTACTLSHVHASRLWQWQRVHHDPLAVGERCMGVPGCHHRVTGSPGAAGCCCAALYTMPKRDPWVCLLRLSWISESVWLRILHRSRMAGVDVVGEYLRRSNWGRKCSHTDGAVRAQTINDRSDVKSAKAPLGL